MKEAFFTERGMYYRISEMRADLPTIVFIHGLSGSSSAWHPYERALEGKYNIISPDLRGHGRSRKLLFYSAYTPELMASDLVMLLAHLKVRHSIVVAHSFGTLLALEITRQAPDTFSSAVLINPTYGASKAWWLPLARILAAFFHGLSLILPFDPYPRGQVNYEALTPTWDWSPRRIVQDIRNTSMRVYVFCVRHIYTLDSESWWKSLRIPTLILHGGKDTVIAPIHAEELHRLLPNSRFVLVKEADHMLPLNFPDKVCASIEDFLKTAAMKSAPRDV
ncbi:alpha/beta hydrolase [Candidatus Parcubacteria bacterium]|nr:MAG: alpha/beta hydrolase [Candidatus Parcubacteria bacterium]